MRSGLILKLGCDQPLGVFFRNRSPDRVPLVSGYFEPIHEQPHRVLVLEGIAQ